MRRREDLATALARKVYHIIRRRREEKPEEPPKTLVRKLLAITGGASIFSGEKAETLIVVDPNKPVSLHNLCPCTEKERRLLGMRRVSGPFPEEARNKLERLVFAATSSICRTSSSTVQYSS